MHDQFVWTTNLNWLESGSSQQMGTSYLAIGLNFLLGNLHHSTIFLKDQLVFPQPRMKHSTSRSAPWSRLVISLKLQALFVSAELFAQILDHLHDWFLCHCVSQSWAQLWHESWRRCSSSPFYWYNYIGSLIALDTLLVSGSQIVPLVSPIKEPPNNVICFPANKEIYNTSTTFF